MFVPNRSILSASDRKFRFPLVLLFLQQGKWHQLIDLLVKYGHTLVNT